MGENNHCTAFFNKRIFPDQEGFVVQDNDDYLERVSENRLNYWVSASLGTTRSENSFF